MSSRKINKRSSGISQPQNGKIRPVWAFPPRFGKLQGREGLPIHSFRPPASRVRGGRARASSAPCGLGASAAEFRAARKAPSVQLFARLYCRSFRAKSRTAERLWSLTQNFPGNGLRKPRFGMPIFAVVEARFRKLHHAARAERPAKSQSSRPELRGPAGGGWELWPDLSDAARRCAAISALKFRECGRAGAARAAAFPFPKIPAVPFRAHTELKPQKIPFPNFLLEILEAAPAREAHPNRKFFPVLSPKIPRQKRFQPRKPAYLNWFPNTTSPDFSPFRFRRRSGSKA